MELDINLVINSSIINDSRNLGDFKGITFSKFNKTEVTKTLLLNLSRGKIESACHWCAELICSGHFTELWEIILLYVGKFIHLGNPKLIIYLETRYDLFISIIDEENYSSFLDLRNNQIIRKLFAEIICILCQSKTMHSFEPIKINHDEDFDIEFISQRLKASTTVYLKPFFTDKDPNVFYIAINEFAFSISNSKPDMITACYWIEWVIEKESYSKKNKESHFCGKRSYIPVNSIYQTDIIWIIWDALLYYGKKKEILIQKILSSLLNLFCIKYTTASCKKRKYLLYFAVGLLIENIQTNINLVSDKNILQTVISHIDTIYEQIKINGSNTIVDNNNPLNKKFKSINQIIPWELV
jgi:hypothetical protein